MDAHNSDKACFFLLRPEYNKPMPGFIIHTKADEMPIHTMSAGANCEFNFVRRESPPVPSSMKSVPFIVVDVCCWRMTPALDIWEK